MGTIRLDIAPYGHECETCQNANYRRPGMADPEYPCAIYALTIGAGYRQPSYLCPDCLNVLRGTLGVKNQRTALTGCDPRLRVLPVNAHRNNAHEFACDYPVNPCSCREGQ